MIWDPKHECMSLADRQRLQLFRLKEQLARLWATVPFYRERWTGQHFGVLRDLVRAMCLDSMEELQKAWSTINRNGGPGLQPRAMELLNRMPGRPEPIRWRTIADEAGRRDRPGGDRPEEGPGRECRLAPRSHRLFRPIASRVRSGSLDS